MWSTETGRDGKDRRYYSVILILIYFFACKVEFPPFRNGTGNHAPVTQVYYTR